MTLAGVLAVVGGTLLWRSRRVYSDLMPTGRLLLVALGFLAWQAGSRVAHEDVAAQKQIKSMPPEFMARVSGHVAEEPVFKAESWQLILRDVVVEPLTTTTQPRRMVQRLCLTLRDYAAKTFIENPRALPLPGQNVRVIGRIQPLIAPRTPNNFDSMQYWRSRELQARLTVSQPEYLETGPPPQGMWSDFLDLMRQARQAIGALFERELPHPQANLARAFFLGEAERLELADRDAFRATGLSHLMAVSGFNTALVLLVILVFARIFGMPPRPAIGVGMLAIAVFTALTGFEPPVVRAAFMSFFILTAYLLGRPGGTLSGFAAAVFVSLVLEPRNLLRIDWQLSYSCVLSLLLFTGPLLHLLGKSLAIESEKTLEIPTNVWRRIFQRWLLLPLAATFAVQLGLLPLQLYYFRQINLLFPLANLVGIALGSAAMISLTMLVLIGWIPWFAIAATWAASICLELLMQFIRALQSAHAAQVPSPPMPLPIMFLFYMVLLSGCWVRFSSGPESETSGKRHLIFRLAALLLVLAWLPVLMGAGRSGGFDLYLLDVGQGDAIVIRAPNQRVMVIDAGRNHPRDEGRFTVGPFLDALGIRRIDVLVATHADADHIGGIPWLLSHYDVGCVLHGPDVSSSHVFAATRAIELQRHVPVYQVEWGAVLRGFGPLDIHCIAPVPGLDNNDASIVLLLNYLKTDIMLTGDLGVRGEQAILRAGLARHIEVLKVGHHGSRTASSEGFLNALRPELALISVGAHNRYGHPAPEVLERFNQHHIPAFRTDQCGTLWLHSDGKKIALYSYER